MADNVTSLFRSAAGHSPSMAALAMRRPRRRLMPNATAKHTEKPPQNAATKPNWRTWSDEIFDIATNISDGNAK